MAKTQPPSLTPEEDLSNENLVKAREDRLAVSLPLRLTRRPSNTADEVIPGILINVSASGLQILTDERFSLLLPPPRGARFEIEFFFDQVEIRQVTIHVVRIEKRGSYQLVLGCKFVRLPAQARLALRAAIAARLATCRH